MDSKYGARLLGRRRGSAFRLGQETRPQQLIRPSSSGTPGTRIPLPRSVRR